MGKSSLCLLQINLRFDDIREHCWLAKPIWEWGQAAAPLNSQSGWYLRRRAVKTWFSPKIYNNKRSMSRLSTGHTKLYFLPPLPGWNPSSKFPILSLLPRATQCLLGVIHDFQLPASSWLEEAAFPGPHGLDVVLKTLNTSLHQGAGERRQKGRTAVAPAGDTVHPAFSSASPLWHDLGFSTPTWPTN